jgi:hypothetical protein
VIAMKMKKSAALLAFLLHVGVDRGAFAQASTGLVSADSSGAIGDKASGVDGLMHPIDRGTAASSDGRFIAFSSYASNLVAGAIARPA